MSALGLTIAPLVRTLIRTLRRSLVRALVGATIRLAIGLAIPRFIGSLLGRRARPLRRPPAVATLFGTRPALRELPLLIRPLLRARLALLALRHLTLSRPALLAARLPALLRRTLALRHRSSCPVLSGRHAWTTTLRHVRRAAWPGLPLTLTRTLTRRWRRATLLHRARRHRCRSHRCWLRGQGWSTTTRRSGCWRGVRTA